MLDLVIRGGSVVSGDGIAPADIAIADGRVAALLRPGEPAEAARMVDAAGRLVLPGLVDVHVHLREPGLTEKEDFSSGTRAAIAGGVTTLAEMPTDEPWTSTAALLTEKRRLAEGRIHADLALQVAVPPDLAGLEAMAEAGAVSFEIFAADTGPDFLISTPAAIRAAIAAIQRVGGVAGISVGDETILAARRLKPGRSTIADYAGMYPPVGEAVGIARSAAIAADTGAPVHIRQTSSAAGIAMFRRLKDMADLTIETSPQLLHFTVEDYERLGPAVKASPPLRRREDVETLREALRDGTLDIVMTDHAPHTLAEKAAHPDDFAQVPGGLAGLQTFLPAMLALVAEGALSLPQLVRACCERPASRFRLPRKGFLRPGFDADLVVLDPARPSTVRNADQLSKARVTPFDGLTVPFAVERVFLRGDDGAGPTGRFLPPG